MIIISSHSVGCIDTVPFNSHDNQNFCINDLPNEIILLIFSFLTLQNLTQTRIVEKKWKKLSNECIRSMYICSYKNKNEYFKTIPSFDLFKEHQIWTLVNYDLDKKTISYHKKFNKLFISGNYTYEINAVNQVAGKQIIKVGTRTAEENGFFKFINKNYLLDGIGQRKVDDATYEGEFKASRFIEGTITSIKNPEWSRFGEYHNNKMLLNGWGWKKSPSVLTAGLYKNNCLNGPGSIICDKYQIEGEFVNDKLNGIGTVRWHNGDQWVGQFIDNRPFGYGTSYSSNGKRKCMLIEEFTRTSKKDKKGN